MKFGRLSAIALAIFAGFSASMSAPTTAKAAEVYFIRGAFNVFSAGMNQMTSKLRSNGVNAKALSNGQWSSVARDIIARSKRGAVSYPIVIAGHSVGGQEAPRFADTLANAGVPVALVIGVDPGFAAPPPFSAGSPRVVNFYIAGSARGKPYRSTSGFHGTINNINIHTFTNADHVQIDKDPQVQSRIVGLVMATVGSGG
jgi:hypothetical protein